MNFEFTKHKKFKSALFLTLLFVGLISLFIFIRYYKIPQAKTELRGYQGKVEELQGKINQFYDAADIQQILQKYNEKAEGIKIFKNARENVFLFAEEDKFDFFPPLLESILPTITKHLHNDIKLEGISINEKGEIVMPVFAPSYTILSKQYASFKQAFENEPNTLLKDIKLNAFATQEIEILERGRRRNFIKKRKKVAKATIAARLNPDFFVKGDDFDSEDEEFNPADFEFDFDFSKESKKKKKSLWQKTKYVFKTIGKNIKKDIDFILGKGSGKKPQPVQETLDISVINEFRSAQIDLNEDINEYYEITSKPENQKEMSLKIKIYEQEDQDYTIKNLAEVELEALSAIIDEKRKNIIVAGGDNNKDKFYFDIKNEEFISDSDQYSIALNNNVITIEEKSEDGSEEKELITTVMPPFKIKGVVWDTISTKISEFLAAGKKIVVEEYEVDPYQEYTEEELKTTAVNMMQRILIKSPRRLVLFHKKDFDPNTYEEDVIDLLILNEQ